MLQAVVQAQTQIGRRVGGAQGAQRRQRHGRKVRRTLLAKHLIQFRRSQHQHLRHLAHAPPLFVAVGRRRQVANLHQGLPRGRRALEFLQEIQHRRLVGALRVEAVVLGEPLAKFAARGQQQSRDGAPPRVIRRIGTQRRTVLRPVREIRPRRTRALRRTVHQARQRSDPLRAEGVARANQHARYQDPQILIEVLADPLQLRLIEGARRLQSSRQQRQPAVAARQHVGDERQELSPALIVERQHPIDRDAESIALPHAPTRGAPPPRSRASRRRALEARRPRRR